MVDAERSSAVAVEDTEAFGFEVSTGGVGNSKGCEGAASIEASTISASPSRSPEAVTKHAGSTMDSFLGGKPCFICWF